MCWRLWSFFQFKTIIFISINIVSLHKQRKFPQTQTRTEVEKMSGEEEENAAELKIPDGNCLIRCCVSS